MLLGCGSTPSAAVALDAAIAPEDAGVEAAPPATLFRACSAFDGGVCPQGFACASVHTRGIPSDGGGDIFGLCSFSCAAPGAALCTDLGGDCFEPVGAPNSAIAWCAPYE
jgi:hypothetical protein